MSFLKRLRGKSFGDIRVYMQRRLYIVCVSAEVKLFGFDWLLSDFRYKLTTSLTTKPLLIQNFNAHLRAQVFLGADSKTELLALTEGRPAIAQHIKKEICDLKEARFRVLSSGKAVFKCNRPIFGLRGYSKPLVDWFTDPRSGYQWSNQELYTRARNYVSHAGADIKVPWELSRAQHLPILGLAYIQGDAASADEIIRQITDWIHLNPVGYGPNWACAMDVGIRVANWLVAIELIKDFLTGREEFVWLVLKAIDQHRIYLEWNLEWTSKLTSNHYSADLVGLLFCYLVMPAGLKRDKKLCWCAKEISREVVKQFRQDGMNHESSVSYHHLVFEMFAFAKNLCEQSGVPLDETAVARLGTAVEFNDWIVDEVSGKAPQIGDNDSGFFLRFFYADLAQGLRFRGLAPLIHSGESKISLLRVALASEAATEKPRITDGFKLFSTSGLAAVKSGAISIYAYCGANGQEGNGGHCHNDRNSFVVFSNGREVLVDPGTGFYTAEPKKRNLFRSTSMHNTVFVNRAEQNRFCSEKGLFSCVEDVRNPSLNVSGLPHGDIEITGRHDGYKARFGVEHERHWRISEALDDIHIRDHITGDGTVIGVAFFLLAGDLCRKEESHSVFETDWGELSFLNADTIDVSACDYSPAYGVINEACLSRVSVAFRGELSTTIKLII